MVVGGSFGFLRGLVETQIHLNIIIIISVVVGLLVHMWVLYSYSSVIFHATSVTSEILPKTKIEDINVCMIGRLEDSWWFSPRCSCWWWHWRFLRGTITGQGGRLRPRWQTLGFPCGRLREPRRRTISRNGGRSAGPRRCCPNSSAGLTPSCPGPWSRRAQTWIWQRRRLARPGRFGAVLGCSTRGCIFQR